MIDLGLIYIQQHYQVPDKTGGRIRFDYPEGKQQFGKIVGSEGPHLVVDFGGRQGKQILHPTWQITYLDGGS